MSERPRSVVVRFSSLGDVVLCGAVTGALAPAAFVTLPRYADVAARLPGVVEVLCPGEDGLAGLARRLSGIPLRVDLHGSLRSRALATLAGGRWRRLARETIRRHARVALKTAPARDLVTRYALAAGVAAAPPPWLDVPGPRDALLVAPGASRATKAWPADRFAETVRAWAGPVLVLGGPGEEALCRAVAGDRAEIVCEEGFRSVLAALGRGAVALGNDSGLTHLCTAAGVPSVVLFGPTCSEDGYWGSRCRAVERGLPCRPCSRHGREACPFGDHLCLAGLSVDEVLSALTQVLPNP